MIFAEKPKKLEVAKKILSEGWLLKVIIQMSEPY